MKTRCLWLLVGILLVAAGMAGTAEARTTVCPPGYYMDGPRGCMPQPYPYPVVPPMYPAQPYRYVPPPPPPPAVYPRPCPPGTVWRRGYCRPVPPPPGIYIGPPVYVWPY